MRMYDLFTAEELTNAETMAHEYEETCAAMGVKATFDGFKTWVSKGVEIKRTSPEAEQVAK